MNPADALAEAGDGRRFALVTGAGTGIGRAVSLALAERGLDVLAVGRRDAPLRQLVEQHHGQASPAAGSITPAPGLDAAEPGRVQELLDATPGRLEVTVASAGAFVRGPVSDLSYPDWDEQVRANLSTAFHTLQAASRRMAAQAEAHGSRGHLVTLNSGAGVVPFPGGAAYAAAKHGLRGLVESLRAELRDSGVAITDLVVHACVESEMSAGRDVAKVPAEVVAQTVLACLDVPRPAVVERVDLGQLP